MSVLYRKTISKYWSNLKSRDPVYLGFLLVMIRPGNGCVTVASAPHGSGFSCAPSRPSRRAADGKAADAGLSRLDYVLSIKEALINHFDKLFDKYCRGLV